MVQQVYSYHILTINNREILLNAGRISKKIADELAEREFEKYSVKQREIEAAQALKELQDDLNAIKKGKNKSVCVLSPNEKYPQ